MARAASAATPAGSPSAIGRPGGVSWQARLLNHFTRRAIKAPVERAGLSAGMARAVVRLLEMMTFTFGDFATVHRKSIAGVPCETVYPLNPPPVERVVLYLHGGGFFVHLPRSYRRFARRLAEACGATVCVPAYRLAPEHRHPAAADDCMAVYRALLVDGCDPRRLCVMGDSAGGNLALVTLLRARDERLPLPACAIVMSPGADLTFSGDSYRRNSGADPLVPLNALDQVARQYVDADDIAHPHVSPIRGDFAGLPPLQVVVGSTEVLLDDSVTIAATHRAAGGDAVLQVWHQMPHVFPLYAFLPEGRMAVRHIVDFLDRHTAAPGAPRRRSPEHGGR
jgi:acetyl esterase/lipase